MKIIDEGMLGIMDTGIEDMRPRQSLPKVLLEMVLFI